MPPRVEVVHATSPLCSWSWGYQAVLNRLELVYGRQVSFTVAQAVPYVERDQWLKDYEMSASEAVEFEREVAKAIAVPVRVPERWDDLPDSCVPAALAVKAAGIVHGAAVERRFARALMTAWLVDGRDTARDEVVSDVVRSLGLDLPGMLKAVEGEEAARALGEDGARAGHGSNFYSLLVRDGRGRTVVLERAFDPAAVESAIDWLAGRRLRKERPRDLVGYVRGSRDVPLVEVQRVFSWTGRVAKAALAKAERAGDLAHRDVPGVGRFWNAKT